MDGKLQVLRPQTQLTYRARGSVRECAQWDERGNRFLVSLFEGGMGAVSYQPNLISGRLIKEQVLVSHAPRPGLSNLGFRIDYPRNRVVCCATDKKRLLLSTIVAYNYTTWDTLFVVQLAGPDQAKALADDLTIDAVGDIYVTDSYNGKIWKVKSDGSAFHVFSDSPLYKMRDPSHRYFGWVRLNGICYHPDGFLLVAHTGCSALFKVSMDGKRVKMVEGLDQGIQLLGDGLVLQKDKQSMALAGLDAGVHLLETRDGWESVTVTQSCPRLPCELGTAVTLKDDGHVFASFVFDTREPHGSEESLKVLTIGEPIFRPLKSQRKNLYSQSQRKNLYFCDVPYLSDIFDRSLPYISDVPPDFYINLYSGLPVDM